MSEGKDETAEDVFVRNMRRLRQRNGWSQEGLAREVHDQGWPLPASAITKLEWRLDPSRPGQVNRRLTLNEAEAIARAFGTKASLMDDPGQAPVPDLPELLDERYERVLLLRAQHAHALAELNQAEAMAAANEMSLRVAEAELAEALTKAGLPDGAARRLLRDL